MLPILKAYAHHWWTSLSRCFIWFKISKPFFWHPRLKTCMKNILILNSDLYFCCYADIWYDEPVNISSFFMHSMFNQNCFCSFKIFIFFKNSTEILTVIFLRTEVENNVINISLIFSCKQWATSVPNISIFHIFSLLLQTYHLYKKLWENEKY